MKTVKVYTIREGRRSSTRTGIQRRLKEKTKRRMGEGTGEGRG
jgi:hypothetical protein